MSAVSNPPAFPVPAEMIDGHQVMPAFPGMTLRDWFAGQALVEFASLITVALPDTMNVTARLAYQMADAMLAAREAKP